MSDWPATRAGRVLRALFRAGWTIKRQRGSHRTLSRPGWPDYVFAFHDDEELGPRMPARIAKHTGLQANDLQNRQHASPMGFCPFRRQPPHKANACLRQRVFPACAINA